jgi:hypothetical protein
MLPRPLTFSVLEIPTGLPSGTTAFSGLDEKVTGPAGALAANHNQATVATARCFNLMRGM